MKPYTKLRDYQASDDLTFGLYERDEVMYYQVNSDPITSSKEDNCETELAITMSSPYRPAKQPRILIIGLGLGSVLNTFAEMLPQQKATFEILDLNKKAFEWYQEFTQTDPETFKRCIFQTEEVQAFLRSKPDVYHGIFVDPELWRASGSQEDLMSKPFLNTFVSGLKMGGLLGVVTERPDKIVAGRMERSGLEVRTERVSAVPGGKRQRTIWLAKKGFYRKEGS